VPIYIAENLLSIWDSGRFKGLVEITSAVAVVLGLIFVGLELKQNTAAISAQAIFELNASSNEAFREVAQNPELADLLNRGYADPQTLDTNERYRFNYWLRSVFNANESAYLYYKKGLIEESDFAGWRGALCGLLRRKGAEQFWTGNLGNYADGFVEDVNDWCLD
jgi:hypothetical protein